MDVSGLVTGALLLVLRVSKVFGLAPVTFTRVDNAYRITLSSSVSYYGYALVGILCLSVSVDYVQNVLLSMRIRLFAITMNTTSILLKISLLCCGILGSKSRMTNLIVTNNLTKKHNVSTEWRGISLVIACFMLRLYYFNIFGFFNLEDDKKSFITFFITINKDLINFVVSLVEMNVVLVAFEMRKYFGAIRDALTKLRKSIISDKKSVHTDTLITLRVLSKAYTASCELIMQYNTTENLTAMVLFVMYTIQLTFTIKNFATGLGASDLKQRAEACSGEVVWLIFHTVRAVSFIEPWYQISREMMTINKELGQVAQSVTSIGEEMPMELNTFCSQTMINKPNLTPFGCFTVTRSQLGEIISVVMTYTLVIIQV